MFLEVSDLKNEELQLVLQRTAEADPEKGLVPAYYFSICLADNTPVGECDFRVGENERLYYGGQIGYGIWPPYRGHHYAGKACLLLFELARRHGFTTLRITCNPENIASRKTCEYAGGELEAVVDLPKDNDMYQAGERKKCIYRFTLGKKDEG